eukprot:CAMPEP_0178445902 /NCGR_PEP_ID=MMETSP0689_2-20121128/40463_1 /TAXON_ID=160604 /ORGANISM="Amphidinium massartii, Strain CS-259" /LENGTH=532 /DNA_ID=CAMNT_0020070581 /DNA_START=75 /DNA_END=1673 /DNA_ORIENTATION=+
MAAAPGGLSRLQAPPGNATFAAQLRDQFRAWTSSGQDALILRGVTLSKALLVDAANCDIASLPVADEEGNVHADMLLKGGKIAAVASPGCLPDCEGASAIDMQHRLVWSCFCEPHAHLFKTQACPRCPNPTGAMNDSRHCEASDRPWSYDDIRRRMEFTLKCSLAHGVRLIRTHLDGCEDDRPEQRAACWKAFDTLRSDFEGAIELQGVANLFLPMWSSELHRERHLKEILARRPHVILGAYCGAIREDDFENALTHFRTLFALACEHKLPVDLHIDETNDPSARGLLAALTALQEVRSQGYSCPVLCGHCCALTRVPEGVLQQTIDAMVKATGIVVAANPPTNLWLQDRRGQDEAVGVAIPEDIPRTPLWRGLTACQELQAAGVEVGIGGDNVRDWWHNYGDGDSLDNLRLGVYAAHLDKPHGSLGNWAGAISRVPAKGFGEEFLQSVLGKHTALALGVDAPIDLVIFNARSFSELLSRPQADRIVVRSLGASGKACLVESGLPEYSELDDLVDQKTVVDRGALLHKAPKD